MKNQGFNITIIIGLIHSLGAISTTWACEKLESPDDVLQCAKSRSVDVRVQQKGVEVSDHGLEAAAQLRNPELELEALRNSTAGWTTGGKLMQPIELGGKRSARISIATAERAIAANRLLNSQEIAAVETVLILYRLRQITAEISIAKENLETFEAISRTYQTAGRLNPEQGISLSVFRLAVEESKLRILQLENENTLLVSKIEGQLGMQLPKDYSKLLPALKREWPTLSPVVLSGSQTRELEVSVSRAEAVLEGEKSLAWPDLSIGPVIENTTGPEYERKLGGAISFPIPLLSTNGGAKAKARAEVEQAELSRSLHRGRIDREYTALRMIYEQTRSALTKAVQTTTVEDKHKDVHRLINRGIISAPLVIELHRQMTDYFERLHEQETKGVEALWRVFALEGRILKERLQ